MKTFLHYLNWAIYDLRNLLWNSLVMPTLKGWGLIAFTIFLCLPIYFINNEVFWFTWTFVVFVFLAFFIIAYMHYFDSRRINVADPLVITDSDGDLWAFKGEELPPPLTIQESARQAVSWTWYLFIVLIGAVVLTEFFGKYIADFISYIL